MILEEIQEVSLPFLLIKFNPHQVHLLQGFCYQPEGVVDLLQELRRGHRSVHLQLHSDFVALALLMNNAPERLLRLEKLRDLYFLLGLPLLLLLRLLLALSLLRLFRLLLGLAHLDEGAAALALVPHEPVV